MSDEPNQPTPPQPEEKPSEPAPVAPPVLPASTSAPPVIPPRKSPIPKKPTPSWVFPLLRCILAFGIVGLGCLALVIPGYFLSDWDWPHVWAIILLVACGLFAVMSLMVIVGGAFDIRKLLRRLREQEANGDPDATD